MGVVNSPFIVGVNGKITILFLTHALVNAHLENDGLIGMAVVDKIIKKKTFFCNTITHILMPPDMKPVAKCHRRRPHARYE